MSKTDLEKNFTAEVVDLSFCRGGNMRGDGTCQLIPTNPPTGERGKCVRYECRFGPDKKSFYEPKKFSGLGGI